MAEDMEKPLLDPENFNQEGIDLERLPLEEVFERLETSKEGLSSEDAEARLMIFGPNKLEEKPENKFLKFLGFMWNPLSWVMKAAAVMGIVLANGGVLRHGQWQEKDAAILVPGHIISIKLGDIIPADARLLEGDQLKIDQSALTGESLAVTKRTGDLVFSGSTFKHGEIEAVVIATGVGSFLGKAAHLVDSTEVVGHFQQVLPSIGNICICSIAVGMIVEIIVMFPIQHLTYRDGINNLLVLLIGGIPIAMPTVLSVTLAIGSYRLSQQTVFTSKKYFGKEDRPAKWVLSQRSLQGVMSLDLEANGRRNLRSSLIAEQAMRQAEIARLGELHTLRGHKESVVRLKKPDLNAIKSVHRV